MAALGTEAKRIRATAETNIKSFEYCIFPDDLREGQGPKRIGGERERGRESMGDVM